MLDFYFMMRNLEKQIHQALLKGRFSHAILLVGSLPNTHQLAVFIAQRLLCSSSDAPCQTCLHCMRILKQTHPNVHWTGQQEGEIKVDEIRALIEKTHLKPFEPGPQIHILYAHNLNKSSSNALLKTLEESKPHQYIVLLAPSLASLLPTLRSRCQIFQVPYKANSEQLPDAAATKWFDDIQQATDIKERASLVQGILKDTEHLDVLLKNLQRKALQQAWSTGQKESKYWFLIAQALQEACVHLAQNGNSQLILERLLLLDWPVSKPKSPSKKA